MAGIISMVGIISVAVQATAPEGCQPAGVEAEGGLCFTFLGHRMPFRLRKDTLCLIYARQDLVKRF